MTERSAGGTYGDPTDSARERVRNRQANPAFKKDPVWGGIPVPKTQPWRPFQERETVEKVGQRARMRRRRSKGPSE